MDIYIHLYVYIVILNVYVLRMDAHTKPMEEEVRKGT